MYIDDLVELYIQPIFYVNKTKIDGAEALIRPLDKRETVGSILKIIDKNRLYLQLDKYVLQGVCKFIKENKIPYRVSLNMSKESLETPGYYKMILRVLKENKIEFKQIILEVHETTEYTKREVRENINKLMLYGANIAMDDFGTYNATLENLVKFHMHLVKFDKSFLEDMSKESLENMCKLVRDMHRKGIETVIEGVETPEQFEYAKEVGYRYIQGFLLGRPVRVSYYRKLFKGKC